MESAKDRIDKMSDEEVVDFIGSSHKMSRAEEKEIYRRIENMSAKLHEEASRKMLNQTNARR